MIKQKLREGNKNVTTGICMLISDYKLSHFSMRCFKLNIQ